VLVAVAVLVFFIVVVASPSDSGYPIPIIDRLAVDIAAPIASRTEDISAAGSGIAVALTAPVGAWLIQATASVQSEYIALPSSSLILCTSAGNSVNQLGGSATAFKIEISVTYAGIS
jgi:hypothetical protein